MMTEALESIVRYARTKLMEEIAKTDDKTEGIACKGLFPTYVQNKYHDAGEVALHPDTRFPKECMTSYDGTIQTDWTIDTPSIWKSWHSRNPKYALPWEAPSGSHDMYKSGEYMIWSDNSVYQCLEDTNFSPSEYPSAWLKTE